MGGDGEGDVGKVVLEDRDDVLPVLLPVCYAKRFSREAPLTNVVHAACPPALLVAGWVVGLGGVRVSCTALVAAQCPLTCSQVLCTVLCA